MTTEPTIKHRSQTALRSIQHALRTARNTARRRTFVAATIAVLGCTLFGLLCAIALFAFITPFIALRIATLVLLLALIGFAIYKLVSSPLSPFADLNTTARTLEDRVPSFRSDLSSSLSFGDDLESLTTSTTTSPVLVFKTLEHTQNLLETHRDDVRDVLPAPPVARWAAATGVVLAALILFRFVAPDPFQRGARALLFGPEEPATKSAAALSPTQRTSIVANINLTLRPPPYSGLPDQSLLFTSGDIVALEGTEVTFEARALLPVVHAEIILDPSSTPDTAQPSQTTVLLERRTGGRLVATFPLQTSGKYTIRATLEDGTTVEDSASRILKALPDKPPSLSILHPEAELEVSPNDVVNFEFEASDDFGLTEIAIVTVLNGDETNKSRTLLKAFDGAPSLVPGDAKAREDDTKKRMRSTHMLDLLPFKLQPKDTLTVVFEASDNNSVRGPNITVSDPVLLRVFSAEDKHIQLIQELEELFEALVLNLADLLEQPIADINTDANGQTTRTVPPESSVEDLIARIQRATPPHIDALKIIDTLLQLTERMTQDPLALKRDVDLLNGVTNDLRKRHNTETDLLTLIQPAVENATLRHDTVRRFASVRRLTIRSTEQGILRIEDLIASQRMDSALDTAKQLKEAKERLKELLKKYKESKDPALKAEIMREIMRLRQRMAELMARMRQNIKKLPSEHINYEALEKAEMTQNVNNMADALDKLQQALEQDNIDAAMNALDQMDQDIDSMLSEMESDSDEMQPDGLSELDQKVSELMDEINNLQAQEEQLARDNEQLNKDIDASQREELERELNEFSKEKLKELNDIQKQLDAIDPQNLAGPDQEDIQHARNLSKSLQQALQQNDLDQASKLADKLSNTLQKSGFSLQMRSRGLPKSSPQGSSYNRASKSISKASPKANKLSDDIQEALNQARSRRASGPHKEALQKLAKRQGDIQKRAESLERKLDSMDGQFPMLREQLSPGLKKTKQYMKNAKKRLDQAQGKPAHDNESMALDQLGKLKQSLKQTLQREKMGKNGRPESREKVVIPEQDTQAPKEFREDIMDAMKNDGLDSYKDELKLYYESLVR